MSIHSCRLCGKPALPSDDLCGDCLSVQNWLELARLGGFSLVNAAMVREERASVKLSKPAEETKDDED